VEVGKRAILGREAQVRRWTALAAVCSSITACDLAQPAILDWRSKFLGAVGGAAIYTLVAGGAVAHKRWSVVIAVAMPIIPIATLLLWTAGWAPVEPDAWMVVILGLQLVAAGIARAELWPG
jgi:hypothetical protein